ncbi:hypothetical protein SESBI_15310 [Sesbania bispinosa]|nr:hypothetical protein SESBI_15310 [Sesbania bispinosa]
MVNKACMMKLGWRLCVQKDQLWARVLRGDGTQVDFWYHHWVPNTGALYHWVVQPKLLNQAYTTVADFVSYSGQWKELEMREVGDLPIMERILNLHPPTADGTAGSVAWSPINDGIFSLSSAYQLLTQGSQQAPDPVFKLSWKLDGP